MPRIALLVALFSCAILLGVSSVEAVTAPLYGSGFQWLRDDDGDGIPNHLDPDWVRPEDGTGYMMKHGFFLPTTCSPIGAAQSRQTHRLRWQHQVKFPDTQTSPIHDRIHDRLRDQLRDGTSDQVRLRLRDGSCK